MPLPHFLTMIAMVIAAAGATIALFTVFDMPLAALGMAALFGSLFLGWVRLFR
jgi:EamA domain-containing membrane protein RarD